MHIINWSIERPPKAVIEGFRQIPSAIVSDSQGRQRSMNSAMKPLYSGARVCGPALTVKTYAHDNLMLHKALQIAQPGDVLVCEAGRYTEGALWGDLISTSAQVKGIAGLVLEGAVRDRDDIAALGFPVFCTAVLPGGTYKSNPGSINIPISCGGVVVNPGDIVVGDSDGVVIVPREYAEEILAKCQETLAKEEDMRRRVLNGELIFD
ncbi:MAG: 4-carboxy-4-hydroxy-2-oxoadipate aldolase/oxaloacetate decarboxylase, partial [Limnochordia bacterium]